MTTKRKQILKALAVAGSQIVDDLVDSTGLQRKNLQDNLKATLEAGLIERIRDDVTGLPAYRLTAKGRGWLESDKDDSTSKPPIPTLLTHKPMLRSEPSSSVTTPAGGGDISPAVKDGATSLAVATPGQALTVVEPPKPDESPAAVGSDEIKQLGIANDWLRCELDAANEELDRLRKEITTLNDGLFSARQAVFNEGLGRIEAEDKLKAQSQVIGYTVILNTPDQLIHEDLYSARREAQDYLLNDAVQNDTVHVAAIVDTARVSITWSNAA